MITLTDQQLDFLEQEIQQRGIHHADLGGQLLDHFACGIEAEMNAGMGFQEAYHKVYMQVSPNGLEEIDLSFTLVILHSKYSFMKKFVFLLGFLSAFVFSVGYIFKSMYWPGANILIILGTSAFTLGFLPMYFRLKYVSDKAAGRVRAVSLYAMDCVMIMSLTLAMLYRWMHWPGSGWVLLIAQLFLTFVVFPKVFFGWYKKFSETSVPA